MKLEHISLYGGIDELKTVSDHIEKRIKFHKEAARLATEIHGEESYEAAIHMHICIELYDVKELLYNRFMKIANQFNLGKNGEIQ